MKVHTPIGDGKILPFEEHVAAAMAELRGALMALMAEVGADPEKPREFARQIGLDKSLAWKICRIAQTPAATEAVPYVPGAAGVRITLEAFERVGARPVSIEAARAAVAEFERLVEVHTGDRRTLDLIVGNLATTTERQEQHRKVVFEGNSAIWGVQARTQLATIIVAPSADGERIDIVRLGGVVDFCRLRPNTRWLLFRRYTVQDDGSKIPDTAWEPIDPQSSEDDELPLLTAYCSSPKPHVECIRFGNEDLYELPEGPIGNTAALTCVYGALMRRMGTLRRDEHNTHLELACNMMTPVESVMVDVLVHESMTWAKSPESAVFGLINGGPPHQKSRREQYRLPVHAGLHELGRSLNTMATTRVPRYTSILEDVFNHVGWNAAEFRGLRCEIAYPPLPTVCIISFELPE